MVINTQIKKQELSLNPKAWNVISNHYVDERRHSDAQRSLFWQRIITIFIAAGSLGNIAVMLLKG